MDRPDTSISSAERELRIGRLLNDFLDRRARGEPVSTESLLAANPSLALELRAHLGLLTELGPDHKRLEDLIGRGILARSPDPHYAASLGPYGVLRCIGRGGMGLVLQAYDASLGRTIALKILRPDLAGEPAALARFEREAKAAAALQHPNIVTVHAIGREHGVPYIVMEYIAGPGLAEVIRGPAGTAAHEQPVRRTALDPALTRHVFEQLLSALDAAHGAGLIHRDVKSSNILLDWRAASHTPAPLDPSNPRPLGPSAPRPLPLIKLADFGLARMRSSQTQVTVDGSVLGTPEYMSPEQARGAEVDHRTDLYSAGVVLYEMLTGQTPFKADTPTATIQRILNEPPRDPRRLTTDADPVLASIALKLMAKEPAQRFRSAGAAREAISKGRPVRGPASSRFWRRPSTGVVGGVVAVILLTSIIWGAARLAAWPAISHLGIDPQTQRNVLVRYGTSTTFEIVPEVPSNAKLGDVTLVQTTDSESVLVVGARENFDEQGCTLIGLLRMGPRRFTERWRLPLHLDHPFARAGTPPSVYLVRRVLAAEVDGQSGEEVVVLAGDPRHSGTRVTVVDPRSAKLGQTFWHVGQLGRMFVLPSYFADGRTALLLWGQYDITDPFILPCQENRERIGGQNAHHLVPVVMILDPQKMDGVWPPAVGSFALRTVTPYAYAYVDTFIADGRFGADANGVVCDTTDTPVLDIRAATMESPPPGNASRAPCCRIKFGGASVLVDRDLTVLDVTTTDGAEINDPAEWRARWHPVVRRGELLCGPAREAAGPP